MAKPILVLGATGKQGSALISSLLDSPDSASSYTLLALTRSPQGPAAKSLADKGVKIVEGNLNDAAAVLDSAKDIAGKPIYGIFAVFVSQGPGASPEIEEKQGKALVDAAIANDVKYFVYSSVDRGGNEKSWDNPTNIAHFKSKHNVELHLRDQSHAAGGGMSWTILRPTAFMDNSQPSYVARVFHTIWRLKLPHPKKLQLIATADIGHIAAACFEAPDVYSSRAISLAGDEITYADASAIVGQKAGLEGGFPEAYEFVTKGVLWAITDMNVMFDWFASDGYKADIEECKGIYPDLKNWEAWVESSAWSKHD